MWDQVRFDFQLFFVETSDRSCFPMLDAISLEGLEGMIKLHFDGPATKQFYPARQKHYAWG